MHGQGKQCIPQEGIEFTGEFVDGSPYGFGRKKGPGFEYEGYFKSGFFEGFGKLTEYKSPGKVTVFEGNFYDGLKHGNGTYVDWSKKERLTGTWVRDLK